MKSMNFNICSIQLAIVMLHCKYTTIINEIGKISIKKWRQPNIAYQGSPMGDDYY